MAPEVCLCKPYGLKADVYSFGLLFYQLCTLKLPFGKIEYDWHIRWAVKRGTRPRIPLAVPRLLRDLVKACWSPEPSDRPSFKDICARLPADINSLEPTDDLLDRSHHLLDQSMHSLEHFMDSLREQSQLSHA
jgi:serine/threonine protein kinase